MSDRKTFEVLFLLRQDSPAAREILRGMLCASGVSPAVFVEQEGKKSFSISVYSENPSEAKRLAAVFRRSSVKNVKVVFKTHCESDWSTRWKKGWKPFSLTKRLQVIPLWQKDRRCPKGKEAVYLDTANAFGTGLHETTRFSAQLIESLRGRFSSFLDVGTGSGILLIVANKSDAGLIEGFDIDASAVKVARANLKVNGIRHARLYAADVSAFKGKKSFDLVAANLVTQDLIAFKKSILPHVASGGYLVVSGISLKNLAFFRRNFKGPSLKCLKVICGKEWAALLFQKGGACV